MTHNDFNRHGLKNWFQQIMAMSRKLQYQLLERKRCGRPPAVYRVDELSKENVRVVFQGVEGAYSQLQCSSILAIRSPRSMWSTGEDAMEAIAEGAAQTMQCCD